MAKNMSLFLLLSLFAPFTLSYPTQVSQNFTALRDPETGLKYMWYPKEGTGEMVKAFLEGGPRVSSLRAIQDDVHFYLYTRHNPNSPHTLRPDCDSCIEGSHWDRTAPLKIISHGFMSDYQSNINTLMKNAYLEFIGNVNIVVINWEALAAAPWYDTAAANTRPVGQYIATFVDYLVRKGYTTYDKVHFSGHSLGSHVAGHCGTHTAQKIARITALDPALPLFGERPDTERIDPTDAVYVDVIHTAGGTLAFVEARGHADFYPNNGQAYQPGCGIDLIATCSHSRAYEFMAESITHRIGFPAYKCNSWEDYANGSCSMDQRTFMGDPASTLARGKYYLRTNQRPPYGQE